MTRLVPVEPRELEDGPPLGRGSFHRRAASLTALGLASLLAVTAVPVTIVQAVGGLADRSRNVKLSDAERLDVPGRHFLTSYGAVRAVRVRLQPGDRYRIEYASGTSKSERETFEIVSLYYLFPAIRVSGATAADAVISVGAPPAGLGAEFDDPVHLGQSVWRAVDR